MNKFLTTLFAGAVALSIGSAAFAADAAKPADPAKVIAASDAAPAKTLKKHHSKKVEKASEVAPAAAK
jgi:Skp family chaperone for outer membrane proteins